MKKLFLLCALLAGTSLATAQQPKMATIAPALKFGDPLPANAFVELAKLINPTVVNISTTIQPRRMSPGGARDPYFDMLEQFFGRPMNRPQQKPQQALGTGFIIREDGLIVTNNHVIAGADVIQVQLVEGESKLYEAKLIGSDDRTDIALIKVNVDKKLPFVQLGNSNELLVGEWVAAFGNPFGQGHTMTKGIISAKGRDIGEINKFPLIQTDTPINPGNSGGPLVNLKGQVIGVNSAIDPRAQGIGFAIPIDEVKTIIPQLEKNGRIRKGYLGVTPGDLDPQAAMQLGLKDTDGSIVLSIERDGPASKAGFRVYDVITEFNGKKINNSNELINTVADAPIGQTVKAEILRDGKTRKLDVVVAERPDFRQKTPADPKKYQGQNAPFNMGFVMADTNDQIRKDYGVPKEFKGAVVIDVDAQSAAAQAGVMPGDMILDVNREEATNAKDVIRKLKNGTNTLRLARADGAVRVAVLRAQ